MVWFIVFNTTFNNIFQLYRGGQFYHINVKKNDNNEKEKIFYGVIVMYISSSIINTGKRNVYQKTLKLCD
jgi:hypothetical protein